MSGNHYKYACAHCSTVKTAAYMVRHILETHPDKFEPHSLRAAYESKKHVAYRGLKKDNEAFTAYCCVGCNKFFHNQTKFQTHFDKCENKQKHYDKCKEMYNAIKGIKGAESPVASDAAMEASAETMAELERLRMENARLKDEQQNQTQTNEIAAKLVKAEKRNEEYRKKIEEMGDAAKLHKEVRELKSDLEDAKSYEYRYNRLRYMLLIGMTRDIYGNIGPILPVEHRRKLVSALEGNKILPIHADGLDSDWYDELLFDDADPTPETLNRKYPMPEYPIQTADDSDE